MVDVEFEEIPLEDEKGRYGTMFKIKEKKQEDKEHK